MLEGWYCRTLANEQAGTQQEETNVDVDGESGSDDSQSAQKVVAVTESQNKAGVTQVDYKSQYRYLKRKLKFLIYENEFFQDALRSNQRRLLKVSRDRAFLLDRLLQYEKPEDTSDSDATESSEDETTKEPKKRKSEPSTGASNVTNSGRGRKRKMPPVSEGPQHKSVIVEKAAVEFQSNVNSQQQNQVQQQQLQVQHQEQQQQHNQGHMTPAEVERHLQSRQSVLELMPERASATVPTEMFSNEPSLDGEPHDQLIDGSPTHIAAEECVPMEYAN